MFFRAFRLPLCVHLRFIVILCREKKKYARIMHYNHVLLIQLMRERERRGKAGGVEKYKTRSSTRATK